MMKLATLSAAALAIALPASADQRGRGGHNDYNFGGRVGH